MSKKETSPGKGVDEPPATKVQIEYLLKLSSLEQAALSKLSKREAAELIDELLEKQREAEDALLAVGRRSCFIKALIIVILLAAIGGLLWEKKRRENGAKPFELGAWKEFFKPLESAPDKPAPGKDAEPAPAAKVASAPPADTPPADTPPVKAVPAPVWPPEKLPAYYLATQPVELLAEDGSKVTIKAGQTIRVLDSPRPRVWRFQYGGRLLVGSASRVEGKLAPVE